MNDHVLKKGPVVTQADIDKAVSAQYTVTAWDALGPGVSRDEELQRLTLAVLVLRNGFIVTGESACADLRNFDAALGARLAIENAKAKIWPLLGFELKNLLMLRAAQ